MKIEEAALIVISCLILPPLFQKAYKNQVIADNKNVMKWRALQVEKVGLDLLGLQPKNIDQAPFIEEAGIINN